MSSVCNQRGISLTEVTIAAVLGTLVMAGLVAFYLSSQATWFDASTQAITQREATFVASTIADSVRQSGKAIVNASPDATHSQLALFHKASDVTPYTYFYWNAADSSIHSGTSVGGGGDFGPMTQAKVRRFAVTANGTQVTVDLDLRSGVGTYALITQTVMINRP